MTDSSSPAAAFRALGIDSSLAQALETRGFTELTPVQTALIDPQLAERDVLVSAQTGSGKTVAFGLLIAPSLEGEAPTTAKNSAPRAIVITPTRELANQVREELGWLLESRGLRVVAVTGGTSIVGERRELARGADIVVGTPGRLNDHLSRHAIDGTHVKTLVLDEADEMLDMGFRDELEAILQAVSPERRTVMLSATLPREIEDLARNYMRSPARVAIDRPGASNENISFVAHLVPPAHKVDAIINLLLAAPDDRTMVFVRTRADATDTASQLVQLGFQAAALQGEMGQRERTATLDAFRAGRVQALVATDVAARGIDVPEVTQVIHADLPGDPSALTHRSGRTGRAGRRGTSVLLVPSFARRRAEALLRAAGARATWGPPPSAGDIERAAAERTVARLTDEARVPAATERDLAKKLIEGRDAEELVAILLEESRWRGATAPRTIASSAKRDDRFERDRGRDRDDRGSDRGSASPRPRAEREPGSYAMFRVNYGADDGATASRLLAMLCRRGNVRGSDIGAISVGAGESTFGVKHVAAGTFTESATQRDVRDPHIHILPLDAGEAPAPRAREPRAASPRKAERPAHTRQAREEARADVFAAELEGGMEPAWKPAPSDEAPRRPRRGFDRDESPAEAPPAAAAPPPRSAWAKRERTPVAANPAEDDWVTTEADASSAGGDDEERAPTARDGGHEAPKRGAWKDRGARKGAESPPWARDASGPKREWKKRDDAGAARPAWKAREGGTGSTWKSRDAASGDKPAWKKRDAAGGDKPAWKSRDAASGEKPAWKSRDAASGEKPAWKSRDAASGDKPAWKKRDAAGGEKPAWKKRDDKPSWGARDEGARKTSGAKTGAWTRRTEAAPASPRGAAGAQSWRAADESASPRDRARAKRSTKKK